MCPTKRRYRKKKENKREDIIILIIILVVYRVYRVRIINKYYKRVYFLYVWELQCSSLYTIGLL